ncbi:MAG TPA: adenylyl-sulfate kinase [Streptosporangiaceae bacterium]|nr:adenylyl-sulfate kinase [Streptosporangiaceae bacterium]
MTAGAEAAPSARLADLPAYALSPEQLSDLELLLSGALAPVSGFMTDADVAAVRGSGRLADGTPFPVTVCLDVLANAVPAQLAIATTGQLLLADPEGTPVAVLHITERTPLHMSAPDGTGGPELVRLAGPVVASRQLEHGPFRRLMLTPAQTRARLAEGPVLGYATRGPLGSRQIGQLRHLAGQLRAQILVLPLVGGQAEVVRSPQALIRTVLAAAPSLPAGSLVVPVPLSPRADLAGDPQARARELAIRARIAAAYGATHLMADDSLPADSPLAAAAPVPVVQSGDWAYDPRAEVWRPLALIEAGTEMEDLSADQLGDLLDAGSEIPSWFTPPAVARELRRVRPPRSERGIVLFLTGLSGSGKSTIARDLSDVLSERGDRRVSLLDGDQVRSLLSAGLSFSRADRDLNIARIGFVAAEIARHGGIAICAPIAPFAAARTRVRQLVSEVGDFFLIHVATPVEVCEARDRKGLYAQARAGIIGQFTGVSDPYEEPADAELVLDTATMSRADCVAAVLRLLVAGGWIRDEAK